MAGRRKFGRTLRWTWAIAFAVVFHLGLYWSVALTRDSKQVLRRQTRQFTEIQYIDSETAVKSDALNQQMLLFDPRPLLLPTEWNAANAQGLSDYWQEEGEIFPEFSPMFELEDGNYIDDFGNVPANYDQLTLAQGEFGFPPFRELGRKEANGDFVQEDGLALTVRDLSEGEVLRAFSIYSDATRNVLSDWPEIRPSTFLATVKDGFPVAGLSVVDSSGFDEADRLLNEIVSNGFYGVGGLRDGVYLLEIAP